MTRAQADYFSARRDLWLVLARAFAPPGGETFHRAFVESLPEDLAAIALEVDLDITGELDALVMAAQGLPDSLALQQLYAALFVTPPAPVFMNTAIYLDGAVLGESELTIGEWYAHYGYARQAGFHDLNDHAAVQLEFVAQLYDKAARSAARGEDMEGKALAAEAARFLSEFPRRWITPFLQSLQQCAAERGANNVYTSLAGILLCALGHEHQTSPAHLVGETTGSLPQGSSRGIGALTAEDLAEVAVRLKEAGLDYSHVKQRPEWRDEAFAARLKAAHLTGNAAAC